MGSAFKDYGLGFGGGLIYSILEGLLGNGIIGSLAAPIAAGSIIKGPGGQILATVAGFEAGRNMGRGGMPLPGSQGTGRGEM